MIQSSGPSVDTQETDREEREGCKEKFATTSVLNRMVHVRPPPR